MLNKFAQIAVRIQQNLETVQISQEDLLKNLMQLKQESYYEKALSKLSNSVTSLVSQLTN